MSEYSQQPAMVALHESDESSRRSSWRRDLKEALSGSEQDFTKGSMGRAIVLLAIPMVLEMIMESLFAICDVFFVARLGSDAVATVGLTESVLTLVFAVAIGLSMATTAMVARRIGEKDRDGARNAAVQAIALGAFFSLLISLVGLFYGAEILALMGASPSIITTGSSYATIMLAGNGTIMLIFLMNAVFRGAGNAAIAMRILWISNSINIILDPCFIFGLGPFPELGVQGAAIATNIGRGTGVLLQAIHLLRGSGRLHLRWQDLRLDWSIMLRLLKVSIGGIMQFLIATASWLGLVRIMANFGSEAVAGYTIAIRIIVFALMPSWGLSNAAATLVGQNLGAKQPDRAERSVWICGLWNMAFLGLVGLLFILTAEVIVAIFTTEHEVVRHAVDCLRYVSYGYVFYAFGMVMIQAFNGAGDTSTPTKINFFCYWLFQIPLAYGLAMHTGLQAKGVYLAILAAESVLAVTSILLFRRGEWKLRQI